LLFVDIFDFAWNNKWATGRIPWPDIFYISTLSNYLLRRISRANPPSPSSAMVIGSGTTPM
jgi:hypothetical protein